MGQFNITVGAKVNQPPSQLGIRNISNPNRTNYTLTQNDFTDTTPPYIDPDGDNPIRVNLTTIPSTGTLELSSVPVILNQDISWNDIGLGNLVYVPNSQDALYLEEFLFDIADEGSNTLSGLVGRIRITTQAYLNQPPSAVGNNALNVSHGSITVFTRANFTTETTPAYSDPEGDGASRLRITSLGNDGVLLLNGVQVVINQIINFSDIDSGNLIFLANGTTSGYTNNIGFEIADTGSEQFTA